MSCFFAYVEWPPTKSVFEVKLIKVNRRTCLREDTLHQPIQINIEGTSLYEWDASGALELWLKDKMRRVNHRDGHSKRGSTSETTTSTSIESETEIDDFSSDDWEDWIAPSYVTHVVFLFQVLRSSFLCIVSNLCVYVLVVVM